MEPMIKNDSVEVEEKTGDSAGRLFWGNLFLHGIPIIGSFAALGAVLFFFPISICACGGEEYKYLPKFLFDFPILIPPFLVVLGIASLLFYVMMRGLMAAKEFCLSRLR